MSYTKSESNHIFVEKKQMYRESSFCQINYILINDQQSFRHYLATPLRLGNLISKHKASNMSFNYFFIIQMKDKFLLILALSALILSEGII